MSDDVTLSVADLVEYCRTQAGLLAGRSEMIGEETDALLDEIDRDIAEIRSRLAAHTGGTESTAAGPQPRGTGANDGAIAELDDLETELEEKQAVAETNRARMAAIQDLAAAYTELAADLQATVTDGRTALDRVVRFERDHDAPRYFEDRETILETIVKADE